MIDSLQIAKKAIESQYIGTCDIYEYNNKKNSNNITKHEEIKVYRNKKCKLSFEDTYANTETDTESKVAIKVKLFISPDINIKPGSKIVVTQNERTTEYKNSGEPAVYATHQEIMLDKFKGWA